MIIKNLLYALLVSLLLLTGRLAVSAAGGDSTFYDYHKLTTDEQRIEYLNNIINADLSDNPVLGDSLAGLMLEVAEFSRSRELMCKAYNSLARQYINYGVLRNNLGTGEAYALKCLQLSKASGLDQYTISSYLTLARANRVKPDNQKALEYNNLALSLAVNYGNDSITSVCYSGLSNTWMNMNNKLSSFQNRLSAREFAEKSKSADRIMGTEIDLATFYTSIDEFEKAKDLFYAVIEEARHAKDWEYLMIAQRNLGNIYAVNGQKALGMSFWRQAVKVADSVGRGGYKINIYFDLINYFLNHESAGNALKYFQSEPELTRFLQATGQAFYIDQIKGFYYSEKHQYDSADYYYNRALAGTQTNKNKSENFGFYQNLAKMYSNRKMPAKELFYLQQCLSIADSTGDIALQKEISMAMDSFYLRTGDYKQAIAFEAKYNLYNDSLRKLSEQKDLLSIEIDSQNKRKIKQDEAAVIEKQRRNNIQYLGISAAIATVFILLVLSGAFKISIPVIKALGFFAFIFLFEFVILLADNQIHEWTHGEPWKVMSLKIILVAILFPLHHWLEHKVIHYLLTRNMLPKKTFTLASLRKKIAILKEEEEI